MKCVIIGLGWLGKPLAIQLASLGYEVTGSSRNEVVPAEQESFERFVFQPNTDISKQAVDHLKSAQILVLAFPPSKESADSYAKTCIQLVEQCNDKAKVVLVSSTGVYPNDNKLFCENDLVPSENSTSALEICEFQLKQFLGNRLTIIRMAGLVGENRFPVRFMSASGKEYAADEPVNLIHQTDAVGLIVHCIKQNVFGEVINGCATNHPMKKEYYSWMAEELSIPCPLFYESGSGGKKIDASKSKSLGYLYTYDDPYLFFK